MESPGTTYHAHADSAQDIHVPVEWDLRVRLTPEQHATLYPRPKARKGLPPHTKIIAGSRRKMPIKCYIEEAYIAKLHAYLAAFGANLATSGSTPIHPSNGRVAKESAFWKEWFEAEL